MKANVAKAIDALTEEFRAVLTNAVREMWPKLVAAELMKMSPKPTRRESKIDKPSLLARVRELMAAEPGMPQSEIGAKLGISQTYVSRLLKGVTP